MAPENNTETDILQRLGGCADLLIEAHSEIEYLREQLQISVAHAEHLSRDLINLRMEVYGS